MRKSSPKEFPTMEQLNAELEREKYINRYGRTLRSTLHVLIVVAAIAVLLATLFFPVFRIYGSSMSPSINEDEITLANLYQEIIPLSEIGKRAKIRNASFAEKLGISVQNNNEQDV